MAIEIDTPRIVLPGFGLPIDALSKWARNGKQDRLPHAIADYFASAGITGRERRMLQFMSQITDKPAWNTKVFHKDIIAKWRNEAVRWDGTLPEKGDWWLSEKMFDVCVQELQEKAKAFAETGFVSVLDVEATIVKSDTIVPEELREMLKETVRPLEHVSDQLKDWHPYTGNQVLDLVHPSLFPIVYGLSRALPTGTIPLEDCLSYSGQGETIRDFSAKTYVRYGDWVGPDMIENAWGSYQWLPSNIKFDENGRAKIDSYINNLHPYQRKDLYRVLEQFVDTSIPLWNECLSWFQNRTRLSISGTSDEDYTYPEGVTFPRGEHIREGETQDLENDSEDDDSWAWEHNCHHALDDWRIAHRILTQHEPEYTPQAKHREKNGARPINLCRDFCEQGLQVIFKLANIHLTPDNPDYDGGSWHVEGSLNEHICATALYYYDCENVEESHLAFRQSFDRKVMTMRPAQVCTLRTLLTFPYQIVTHHTLPPAKMYKGLLATMQSEYTSLESYYDVEQEGSTVLELGSVVTRPNRLLVFPNVFQHQVQPFSLEDNTKPGHRKILAMFLVDPHIPILSTANVPPQRRDWWSEEIRTIRPLSELPKEIFDMVIEGVEDFPLSWGAAEEIREQLMDQRLGLQGELEDKMEQSTFSFCEH
ncbi:hypothetical protein K504DRAFT_465561 [Pleomassaria siparia CBS 279.74]|uniref:DUF1665 domain-containing protein n=1 Tax=Pleomassaria siparia CBS 279.74 TaxID=1314801 RepID=A0A6G1KH63_9PLEO|nr:hypothetical protein K504DRAFT_465561 [Pleomassaria siparia CBS 279.74]